MSDVPACPRPRDDGALVMLRAGAVDAIARRLVAVGRVRVGVHGRTGSAS